MNETSTAMVPSATARTLPLVPSHNRVVTGIGSPVSESDLDEAVRQVRTHSADFQHAGWELGRWLAKIRDENLHKLRKGNPYKSWEAFVRDELKMSVEAARQAIRLAKESTPEDVALLGATKASLVLRAEPEDRPALKAAAATQTTPELRQSVKQANDARRTPEERTKEKERATKASASRKKHREKVENIAKNLKVNDQEITLALLIGKKHRIPLFRAEKDKDGNLKPATKAGSAHGWLDLPNGVRLVLQVVEQAGRQPEIILTARRGT